ncbi:MAG: carboxymuconolactone decarboxylase family protein [Candidatus Omnitrophica bacterium]|nr:carboxymuconolactone decarboxylase family protein [Candidatus Omnitrophota bacterium]
MSEKKPWYMKDTELGKAFNHFYLACKEKSVLDDRTRELLMAALACVFRCPHCTEEHIKKALEVGCTKQQVREALLIASVEAAGTQLAWRKEVYEKYLG